MKDFGKIAELKAAVYLRKKKYTILEHNYHSRFGEIDLICADDKNLIFVEVKMRNDKSIASPREFVDDAKQRKIIATANYFLADTKIELQPRFDVIEIYMNNNKIKSLIHLENAFNLV